MGQLSFYVRVKIMRSTLPLLICLLSFLNITQAALDECDKVRADFDICALKAFEKFLKAYHAGDDGRPDWLARKSCNYMTAAVEDCGEMLVGKCHTCEKVTKMKDEQMRRALQKGEKIEASCNFEDVPGLVTETALTAFAVSILILPFLFNQLSKLSHLNV